MRGNRTRAAYWAIALSTALGLVALGGASAAVRQSACSNTVTSEVHRKHDVAFTAAMNHPACGTIVGAILLQGGPPIPKRRRPKPAMSEPGTVTLRSGTLSRTETVKARQRYRFTVPAGRYVLSVRCDGSRLDESFKNVRVRARRTSTVNLSCSAK